jgi:pimeloyl-ACP methyl ester carboxylesterase
LVYTLERGREYFLEPRTSFLEPFLMRCPVKKERFEVPARLDRPEILQFLFYPRREEAWQEHCPEGVEELTIHGEEDEIIPFGDGRELYEASGSPLKRLLRIPGAGHNDLLLRAAREYLQAVRELAESVGAKPRTGRERAPETG